MTKKRSKEGRHVGDGPDLEIGGLFRSLGAFIDIIAKLAEAGERQIERRGEFRVKELGDQTRGVYGFSIRSCIGGGRLQEEADDQSSQSRTGLDRKSPE